MIGDVLTSSILCEAIKTRFRESIVHYLINTHTTPVLENNPFIDRQIVFTPEMEDSLSHRNGLKRAIKNEKYDVVIDVYSKIGSAHLTKTTAAPVRIGYYKWYTKWAYTHTYTYDKKPKTEAGLAIENRVKLLEPIGSDFPNLLKPKIYIIHQEKEKAQLDLSKGGINLQRPKVMISLLGSSKNKTYPLRYMAQLLDHLVNTRDVQLLLNYIPKQQAQVDTVLSYVQETTRKAIFDQIYGKSLREFLALTSACDVMIGNEGGAINMAKALGIPTFSIFSPWITREAWGLFENDQNISFHLKDIRPNIYADKSIKQLKKESTQLYQELSPKEVIQPLDIFLTKNLIV